MIRTKDIMRCLPLVASVLGRRYGVTVHIGGDSAYTDGTVIHLPRLPLDGGENLIALARGFLDHEAAHIRHTDFKALKAAKLTNMERYVWNCIEDWRVEHALAAIYPGCGHNFRWLIRHEFLENAEAGPENPASSILNWILLTIRSWDVPELKGHCAQEAQVANRVFPGLLPKISSILNQAAGHCTSVEDGIVYARQIVELLQQEKDAYPQQKGASRSSFDPHAGEETEQAKKILEQLLSAPADFFPPGMGERLAHALEEQRNTGGNDGLRVAVQGHLPVYPLKDEELRSSGQSCRALRTRLQGLLQAQTLERGVAARHGRLDTRRLYRLAVKNPYVFENLGRRQSLDTAVHILLDASGSMCGDRIRLATASCHAVASALQSIPGVNVGVSVFPAHVPHGEVGVYPLVRHGQRVHQIFSVDAGGGTPLAESLWWIIQRMLPLKEARKLILVITDGEPDNGPSAQKTMATADKIGMEIYGVGIDAPTVGTLFPHWTNITRMEDLASTLFHTLQGALLWKRRTKECG